jgi:hypothetical protein
MAQLHSFSEEEAQTVPLRPLEVERLPLFAVHAERVPDA